MDDLVTIVLTLPRETEVTAESAKTFLASLANINKHSFMSRLLTGKKPKPLSLEILLANQQINFQITCDKSLVSFVESQIQSTYPLVAISKSPNPQSLSNLHLVSLVLKNGSYYPIITFPHFKTIDPLSSILSVLTKADISDTAIIQIALESTGSAWQQNGLTYAQKGIKRDDGNFTARTDSEIIKQKVNIAGFKSSIRIASNSNELLNKIISSYSVFTNPEGNSFVVKKSHLLNKNSLYKTFLERRVTGNQVLNIEELATIWHLPSNLIKTQGIMWEGNVLSEAPDNLPITGEENKQKINFFAKTNFKNKETVFGIKDGDRRRHIWAIGKTGTGKSTLIANLAINDIKKGHGIAIIDPHGDLTEIILEHIPNSRVNDVIYFNPSDREFPISINPLEVVNKEQGELVVSGIISFLELFQFSVKYLVNSGDQGLSIF